MIHQIICSVAHRCRGQHPTVPHSQSRRRQNCDDKAASVTESRKIMQPRQPPNFWQAFEHEAECYHPGREYCLVPGGSVQDKTHCCCTCTHTRRNYLSFYFQANPSETICRLFGNVVFFRLSDVGSPGFDWLWLVVKRWHTLSTWSLEEAQRSSSKRVHTTRWLKPRGGGEASANSVCYTFQRCCDVVYVQCGFNRSSCGGGGRLRAARLHDWSLIKTGGTSRGAL